MKYTCLAPVYADGVLWLAGEVVELSAQQAALVANYVVALVAPEAPKVPNKPPKGKPEAKPSTDS